MSTRNPTSKQINSEARAAQSTKLRKMGADGSLKLARQGEKAPRKYQKYAKGGKVHEREDDDMDAPEGKPAAKRLDRPGRMAGGPMKSKGKEGKGKGATVNIMIAGKSPMGGGPMGPGAGPMPPLPPGPMAGPPGPPGGMPPHPPMPMPPGPGAGPGGPPGPPGLPMRARGGKVERHGEDEMDEDKKVPKRNGFMKMRARGGMAKC